MVELLIVLGSLGLLAIIVLGASGVLNEEACVRCGAHAHGSDGVELADGRGWACSSECWDAVVALMALEGSLREMELGREIWICDVTLRLWSKKLREFVYARVSEFHVVVFDDEKEHSYEEWKRIYDHVEGGEFSMSDVGWLLFLHSTDAREELLSQGEPVTRIKA